MNISIVNGEFYYCDDCGWVEVTTNRVYQHDPSDMISVRNDDGEYHYYEYDCSVAYLNNCDDCGDSYADGEMPYEERLYQCGECGYKYADRDDAVMCCK